MFGIQIHHSIKHVILSLYLKANMEIICIYIFGPKCLYDTQRIISNTLIDSCAKQPGKYWTDEQ